ncbi:MAG: hypothetical protein IJQ95_02615 [Paludibacteraceae bacterium]|nr:hypothetical protein [Paludibacteraceae bacterium]
MNKQHRQYVILIVVLLSCAASVFFGVRNILHSNDDDMTTFAVGDWEGITLPRYDGPTVYATPTQQGYTVTLPMASTSSRSLFHHNAVATYRSGVTTAQRVQTSQGTYRVYQTSDHEMHSIGSGSGASGTASFGTTNYQQSTPSASFSAPTIAMSLPSVRTRTQTLAVNNINMATTSSILADAGTPMAARAMGPRRVLPADPAVGELAQGDDGKWYIYDTEGWVEADTKIEDGKVYVWNGSSWVYKGDQSDPDTPIGTTPWLMILLAAAGYGYYVAKRKQTTK